RKFIDLRQLCRVGSLSLMLVAAACTSAPSSTTASAAAKGPSAEDVLRDYVAIVNRHGHATSAEQQHIADYYDNYAQQLAADRCEAQEMFKLFVPMMDLIENADDSRGRMYEMEARYRLKATLLPQPLCGFPSINVD
ncbi:MAG TPA: hypothetical protein VF920_12090, partial [Dongiaceae bacterium]